VDFPCYGYLPRENNFKSLRKGQGVISVDQDPSACMGIDRLAEYIHLVSSNGFKSTLDRSLARLRLITDTTDM
jgi:hypothetical protein